MDRLRGLGTFALVTGVAFAALRVIHSAIPVLYPAVLTGPFVLSDVEQVRQYAGFTPRVPFYRPERLGASPPSIVVTRRPHPQVSMAWKGEYSLAITQGRGGHRPTTPIDTEWLAGFANGVWWVVGREHHALIREDDFWIKLQTDLGREELMRIADSLRPFSR